MSGQIFKYSPPEWAKDLDSIPSEYVSLAALPTKTHKISYNGIELNISRDDMTGCEMSGNKIRKLEFLLADCIRKGIKTVVTVGGVQSNHCRATVVACRRVGLEPILVFNSDKKPEELPTDGNVIFDRLFKAEIYTRPDGASRDEFGRELAKERNAYFVPTGGSTKLGSWGYIQKWVELEQQGHLETKQNIFFATGSGGTAAGVILGNYLTGNKHSIYLLQIGFTIEELSTALKNILSKFQISGEPADVDRLMKNVQFLPSAGLGYAQSTPEELSFIQDVAVKTGIFFDRVYSGKAFKKTIEYVQENQIENPLFIHTGGVHSISDQTFVDFLKP